MIIGLYFIIFGETFCSVNSILINSVVLGLIFYNISSLFYKINIGSCMIIGIIIAFAVYSFKRINSVMLGIIVGYVFGNLIYNIFIKFFNFNPQTLYWTTVISSILLISIVGGFIDEYMVSIATSLMGAYSLVRVCKINKLGCQSFQWWIP